MVWAGVSSHGKTQVYFIEHGATVTNKYYIEHIVEPLINPFHSISPIWGSHFRMEFLLYLKVIRNIN